MDKPIKNLQGTTTGGADASISDGFKLSKNDLKINPTASGIPITQSMPNILKVNLTTEEPDSPTFDVNRDDSKSASDKSYSVSPSPEIEEREPSSSEAEENDDSSADEGLLARLKSTGKPLDGFAQERPTGDKDKSGYWHISSAIHMMVENENILLPYNIGLVGKHGIGKSKVIEQVKASISEKGSNSKIAGVVEFDAGRHHDKKIIWAALITEFFSTFSRLHKFSGSLRYYFAKEFTLKEFIVISIQISIIVLACVITVTLPFWVFKPAIDKITFLWSTIVFIIANSMFIIPIVILCIYYIRIWRHPLVVNSIKSFNSFPEPLELIKNRSEMEQRLFRLIKAWTGKSKQNRILLIIDNLDRCNNQHVLSIIDELFALMSTPGVKEHLFTLIAVDEAYVLSSIKSERRSVKAVYFEKLFSLKVKIPHIDERTLPFFLEDSIKLPTQKSDSSGLNEYNNTWEDIDFDESEKILFRDTLIKIVGSKQLTPRRINRAIFAFRFIKYLWARIDGEIEQFNPEEIIEGLASQLQGHGITTMFSDKVHRYLSIVPLFDLIDNENDNK